MRRPRTTRNCSIAWRSISGQLVGMDDGAVDRIGAERRRAASGTPPRRAAWPPSRRRRAPASSPAVAAVPWTSAQVGASHQSSTTGGRGASATASATATWSGWRSPGDGADDDVVAVAGRRRAPRRCRGTCSAQPWSGTPSRHDASPRRRPSGRAPRSARRPAVRAARRGADDASDRACERLAVGHRDDHDVAAASRRPAHQPAGAEDLVVGVRRDDHETPADERRPRPAVTTTTSRRRRATSTAAASRPWWS